MAQYFKGDSPIAISMWSSVSQFGDSIAFLLNILIVSGLNIPAFNSLIALAILLIIVTIFDYNFFKEPGEAIKTQ